MLKVEEGEKTAEAEDAEEEELVISEPVTEGSKHFAFGRGGSAHR